MRSARILPVALALGLLGAPTVPAAEIHYPTFTDTTGLTLNGTAVVQDGRMQLTPVNGGVGTVWTSEPVVDPSKSFRTQFVLRMSGGSTPPADGMTFVWHRDPRGATVVGTGGGGLGYSTNNGFPSGTGGISPSIAIEFDIWDNGGDGYDDPNANHISILKDGITSESLDLAIPPFSIYGDTPVRVWVDYAAATHRFDVYATQGTTKPATPLLSTAVDADELFGGPVYAGFTAATGFAFARQDVLSWDVDNRTACADGVDNDKDGYADTGGPGDFDCVSSEDDDERPFDPTPGDVRVTERDEIDHVVTVPVELEGIAGEGGLDVGFETVPGTATGDDFDVDEGSVFVPQGSGVAHIPVRITGDRLDEVPEHFELDVYVDGGAPGPDETLDVEILDDDAPAPVRVRDAYVREGDAGTTDAVFLLELAKPSGKPVSVQYATADDSATAGSDYAARTGRLTFAPGDTTAEVRVPVNGDTVREADFERFALDLLRATNPLDNQRAIATIVDDEQGPAPDPVYPSANVDLTERSVDAVPAGRAAGPVAARKQAARRCAKARKAKAAKRKNRDRCIAAKRRRR